ncbi:hypothetical protein Tco_1278878 [Tanacetum coccineum]
MSSMDEMTCAISVTIVIKRSDRFSVFGMMNKEKEATPADTKQLKEDKLMLVKFNIENESTRILALTPVLSPTVPVLSPFFKSLR